MKKARLFLSVVALILVTAGVFATKNRFFTTPPNMYYYNPAGAGSFNLLDASTVDILTYTTTPTAPFAQISDGAAVPTVFTLYTEPTAGHFYQLNAPW